MRPLISAFVVVSLALSLGCKSEAEKQISDLTGKQKEIVSVLKGVTDKDSAKAASAKLKSIAKDMQAMLTKAKDIKVSETERKQLTDKYKPEQDQLGKDMQAEMQRIAKIPGAAMELMDGMMEIGTAGLRAGAPNR
jgi:Skp family chaperone for outer membrane proteins